MDYITIALLFIGFTLVNAAIGAMVLSYICTKDKDARDWFLYQSDTKCEVFVMLIYTAWPFYLYIWWINRQ